MDRQFSRIENESAKIKCDFSLVEPMSLFVRLAHFMKRHIYASLALGLGAVFTVIFLV